MVIFFVFKSTFVLSVLISFNNDLKLATADDQSPSLQSGLFHKSQYFALLLTSLYRSFMLLITFCLVVCNCSNHIHLT